MQSFTLAKKKQRLFTRKGIDKLLATAIETARPPAGATGTKAA
jgi:hypothetical protein